jgi:uncharacterized phage protein (TIGR01671 family)
MREIKFRIWDNELKWWWCEDSQYLQMDGKKIHPAPWSTLSADLPNDSIVVQQYTGLKDVNGVEIYEGDIIVFPLFENDNTVSYNYFQVIWDNFYSAWSFAKKDGKPLTHTGWRIYYSDTTEVIGNLFENPELLEQ